MFGMALDYFASVFFVAGLIVVAVFAWGRFSEPSFPAKDTLPHTTEPLRYLFLRDDYKKARWVYVTVLVGIYVGFVMQGPDMATALRTLGVEKFPPEAWALVVAVPFARFLPTTNLKLFAMIEGRLRRFIHRCFRVPDDVQRTIGILKSADYRMPAAQLTAVAKQIYEDLAFPRRSLRHRWARAVVLMELLNQTGATSKRFHFDPFQDDFDDISATYKALGLEIPSATETDHSLSRRLDRLLSRIYAYISWGVRSEVTSQSDADQMLKQLGFDIPDYLGDNRLFDVLAPSIFLIAFITAVFWVTVDVVSGMFIEPKIQWSDSVINAVISAIAASFMYGSAVFVALNKRADQIKQGVWRQRFLTRVPPIAVRAGAMTCLVIIVTTVVLRFPDTLQSVAELTKLLMAGSDLPGGIAAAAVSAAGTAAAVSNGGASVTTVPWYFLFLRIAMALPWFMAGATVSVMLAYFLDGDVRQTEKTHAVHDSVVMGIALGLSVTVAQGMQTVIAEHWDPPVNWYYVPIVGFAGFLCGAIIGYMVPRACRENLLSPTDPAMARLLGQLLAQARTVRGSEQAARDWAFSPHNELCELTPAEAVHYERLQADVWRLVDTEAGAPKPSVSKAGDPYTPVDRDVVSRLPYPGIVPAE